ncbi:hypothetical protein NA57DRAFT_69909 [Rhizodiscina lignyota]|uniref:Uncharacterized protein n=1 Tax=Rhizodiscina lignyota TaxID=1504668 RepID=A0A9P4ISZ2_9PEZI|nr:hypothetical protein NA57DRAFT_69909 [Rhizodiscina lignyota]
MGGLDLVRWANFEIGGAALVETTLDDTVFVPSAVIRNLRVKIPRNATRAELIDMFVTHWGTGNSATSLVDEIINFQPIKLAFTRFHRELIQKSKGHKGFRWETVITQVTAAVQSYNNLLSQERHNSTITQELSTVDWYSWLTLVIIDYHIVAGKRRHVPKRDLHPYPDYPGFHQVHPRVFNKADWDRHTRAELSFEASGCQYLDDPLHHLTKMLVPRQMYQDASIQKEGDLFERARHYCLMPLKESTEVEVIAEARDPIALFHQPTERRMAESVGTLTTTPDFDGGISLDTTIKELQVELTRRDDAWPTRLPLDMHQSDIIN